MKTNLILLAVVVLTFMGCSGIRVVADYDKTVNFTQYKTFEYYGWMEESDKILNRFDKERIEEAFGNEFRSRGYELVEEGGDLVVALYIVTQQKTQKTANTYSSGRYYGYGGYYGYGPGWGYGPNYSTTTISEYEYIEGTLVCSIFDKKEEKLIWEGIGTKTVDEDPQTRDKTIPYAVKKIMAQYPIKPLPSEK